MKIGAIQYRVKDINCIEEFEKHVIELVDTAKQQGAETILFPEFFSVELLTIKKYHIDKIDSFDNIFEEFGKEYTDYIKQLFKKLAEKYNMTIAAGSHFCYKNSDGKYYNTAFIFSKYGECYEQDKIHPSYELVYNKHLTTPGNELNVFTIDGVKYGISICYDNSFPEITRILAKQGAEIILVPTCCLDNWGLERNKLFARARACENQVFVINSQLVGGISFPTHIPYGFLFNGQSGIYEPIQSMCGNDTGILSMADRNKEQILIYDIDLDGLRKRKNSGVNCNIKDMRNDFYEKYM